MTKRTSAIVLLAVLALGLLSAACLQHTQNQLAQKLIRLHVVANSDSEADQAIKLRVRDAVLAAAESILSDADDAPTALSAHLSTLEKAAAETLRTLGCDTAVSVTLQNEAFPTRAYETFSLPAGVYRTLRVTIGAGEGHNWWCVVFPSICTAASMNEFETAAAAAGFDEGELHLITGESTPYVLKFKALEWLSAIKSRFFR